MGIRLVDALLALRAIPFRGSAYECPCCGWSLSRFTRGRWSLRSRRAGYCPRCNSKSRHRWVWLHIAPMLEAMADRPHVLHTGPSYPIARRLARMGNLRYCGLDLVERPFVDLRASLTRLPVADGAFDAIVSVHVLEHIEDDRSALIELTRTLRRSGWLAICVPIRLEERTYEDPAITTPEARFRAYGERTHFRVYGRDLLERLSSLGLDVEVHEAANMPAPDRARFGIRDDEVLLLCRAR